MPALQNPKHEAFAQLVGTGSSKAEAYRSVYKTTGTTSDVNGCKLAKRANVELRIKEIEEKHRQHVEEKAEADIKQRFLSIDEKREYLAEAIRTPVGQIDANHPLCQSFKIIFGKEGGSEEYKAVDKLKAIQIDNELAGHVKKDGPTVNVAVGVQTNLLTEERHQALLAKKKAALERRMSLPG